MGLNWKMVTTENVRDACRIVAERTTKSRGKGLFVVLEDKHLPAKDVARISYLLAAKQPIDTALRFASGENLLTFLRKHGCTVVRVAPETGPARGGEEQ
jgi:hypothetical protein